MPRFDRLRRALPGRVHAAYGIVLTIACFAPLTAADVGMQDCSRTSEWQCGPPGSGGIGLVRDCSSAASEPQGLLAGSISGTVEPVAPLVAVTAVNRATGKRFPGKADAATGKWTVADLPLGATYDIILDFKGGRLEGVNMRVPRSEYEEEQPLAEDDIKTIREKIANMNIFEDVVEILAINGNIQHAAILIQKVRTKPFYASKPGEVIWRPELWHFERPEDTWVKVQDELFITLYRERIQKSEYDKRCVVFDSNLGGIELSPKKPSADLGTIKLPDAKPGVRYRGVGACATAAGQR